jgi:hypothetical protein
MNIKINACFSNGLIGVDDSWVSRFVSPGLKIDQFSLKPTKPQMNFVGSPKIDQFNFFNLKNSKETKTRKIMR